ncbi:MAG: Gfo/Idh/MocA family oxidoreductase [Zavarzinella sp.]
MMALDLSAEKKAEGKAAFDDATIELTRRGFMRSMAAGAAIAPVAAAAYFAFDSFKGKPVRAALIGCGDEGGVLLSEHDPKYIEIVSLCDIRPYNQARIIKGEGEKSARRGYKAIYGEAAASKMKVETDYKKILEDKSIEAVIIALPLHLHASVTIEALNAGKHVLCEKLMARTVTECKAMIAAAKKNNKILSIGHQRHYSMLYAHALELIKAGELGDIKHIRALWHRNFSWDWIDDGKAKVVQNAPDLRQVAPMYRDGWFSPIRQEDYDVLKDKYKDYGYKTLEELIRWRLYERTGGGLMAELGSHQLDACSIFLGKVKPLNVMGMGSHSFFGHMDDPKDRRNPRQIDDHVFTTFEFPGKNHPQGPNGGNDKDDVVVVTYSSISTNGFEPYGECVMGSRGTLVVSSESENMLYKEKRPGIAPPAKTSMTADKVSASKPAVEAASTWGPNAAVAEAAKGGGGGKVSRGYKEEMADFAFCIRLMEEEKIANIYEKTTEGKLRHRLPRCHGEVAMADAIVALTSNLAMAKRQLIKFEPAWFDPDSQEVPDKDVNFG